MSAAVPRVQLSPRAQIALSVAGLLLVAALSYLFLIGPKRSEASRLDGELKTLEAQIADLRARAALPPPAKVKAADLYRLAKAMPATTDMPEMLLELNRIAGDTGIVFESISPGGSTAVGPFQIVPINLVFEGNFYSLSDFLFRLRSLVDVHDGRLAATGRLFSVDRVTFSQSQRSFPTIQAALTVNAFVFGTTPAASTAPPVAPTATTETAPTETQPAPEVPSAAPTTSPSS